MYTLTLTVEDANLPYLISSAQDVGAVIESLTHEGVALSEPRNKPRVKRPTRVLSERKEVPMTRVKWGTDEVECLKGYMDMYPEDNMFRAHRADIAQAMGRTVHAIEARRNLIIKERREAKSE